MATARVSRSYAELQLPLPQAFATALPVVFHQKEPPLQIPASDLASRAFCSALPAATARAIPLHLRVFLEGVLDGSIDSSWMSLLALHWHPHLLSLFSASCQRRLRAQGLLEATATLPALDLVGKSITTVHDLTTLLTLAQITAPAQSSAEPFIIPIAGGPPARRKRSPAKLIELVPPQKWRPDPFAACALVFEGGVTIRHNDARYAWWIHLLLTHGPSRPPGPEIAAEPFLLDCRHHDPRLTPLASNLIMSVAAASSMTVQAELEDFAAIVSRVNRHPSAAAAMITSRYGCDGTFRSLGDCAAIFALSSQSIHQTIKTVRSVCSSSDYAPATRALLESFDALAGRSFAAAQDELRPLLGPTQSLEGALHFAKDFFGLSPKTTVYSATPAGANHAARFLGKESATLSVSLFATIRSSMVTAGLAYCADAIASVPRTSSDTVGAQEVKDAIAHDPSIRFLGHDQRWLIWTDPQSPLLQSLAQACHVSHPFPLPLSQAAHALRIHLDAVACPVQPSMDLLTEAVLLMHPSAGASLEEEGLVLNASASPLHWIAAADRPIYEHLLASGGYDDHASLIRALPSLASLSQTIQRERLASCVFLRPIHAGYLLVGWPDPFITNHSPLPAPLYQVDGPRVQVQLTNSAAQRVKPHSRLIYLPAPLNTLIHGDFRHHDGLWPTITVANGRARRLAPIASAIGIADGERFRLDLDLDALTYRLERLSG